MGDVYSQARRVVIWIGESTQVSDDAMQFLKDVVRVSQKKHFRNYSLKRKMRQLYRKWFIHDKNKFRMLV